MFNTPVTMEAFPASIMEDDNPSLREVSGRREEPRSDPGHLNQRSFPLFNIILVRSGSGRSDVFNWYAGSITMVIESK
jgi:hypothetical protein